MPTGYTSKLYNDEPQTFEEFALDCAHAFGALITLRDSPMDAPIPEFVPDVERYDKQISEAYLTLARAESWSPEEAEKEAQDEYNTEIARWDETQERRKGIKARYDAMLANAEAWVPPSADHTPLREFMIEQLEQATKFDCSGFERFKPERKTGDELRASIIERALSTIKSSSEYKAEEIQRCAKRNTWVKLLRESL